MRSLPIQFALAAMLALTASASHAFDNEGQLVAPTREETFSKRIHERPGSFGRVLLSSKGPSSVALELQSRPGCAEAVRRVYAKGKSLYSKTIDEAATKLADFPKQSGSKDNFYHHFTQSEAFMNSFTTRDGFEKIFLFLRSRDMSPMSNWMRVFYVAEDPDTVRHWAPFEIKFTMSDEARMVELKGPLWDKALQEIGEKYPDVGRTCGTYSDVNQRDTHGSFRYHPLAFMIGEDSGIDAIEYNQGGRWFQMLAPDALIDAKAMGRTGGNARGNYWSTPTTPDYSFVEQPLIGIQSVTWGDKDVTEKAAAFADGKSSLEYKVSHYYAGLKDAQKGAFKMSWNCFKGGEPSLPVGPVKVVEFQEAAEGKEFPLHCN